MDKSSRITIFSKSKRDSTQDRQAVHDIIRCALRLNSSTRPREDGKPTVRENVILDAEMVAFQGDNVDGRLDNSFGPHSRMLTVSTEFWRIRELIESTAHGIRGKRRHPDVRLAYE